MKKLLTTLFFYLITLLTFAQQGINYKALIKDDLGNVVANNQNVTIQFEILKGDLLELVYSELHNTSTSINGMAMVNIGEGALIGGSPAFNTIEWQSDEHFLNVKINTGSGLIDMGTTAFKTVPYALSSKDNQWAINGDRISTKNTGNVGIGESNPTAKLDVNGNLRLQLGTSVNEFSADDNLSGNSIIAIPTERAVKTYVDNNDVFKTSNNVTRNSGGNITTDDFLFGSTQLNYNGDETRKFYFDKSKGAIRAGFVNGTQWNTQNIGDFSSAFGFLTEAIGDRSTALGSGTIASRFASTAIGNYNASDSNALFIIGNGTSSVNRKNAFVVKDDGDIVLDGELNTTSTGSANIIPIALGNIFNPGTIGGGTGNFSVSISFINNIYYYIISVNNKSLSLSNTSTFVSRSQNGQSGRYWHSYINGDVWVSFSAGGSDTPIQTDFSFIIYQF